MNGKLIVFEGIDGSGKSTQAKLLSEKLNTLGFNSEYTFEPTNREYGQKLRDSFSSNRLTIDEELNLFILDRKMHIEYDISPWLECGKVVVLDRYYYSSIAYQGARGYDIEKIKSLHADFIIEPDLVFIFNFEIDECLKRIEVSRGVTNLLENKSYLEKVDLIFKKFQGNKFIHIDASLSIEEIHNNILSFVMPLISN